MKSSSDKSDIVYDLTFFSFKKAVFTQGLEISFN